MPGKILVVEDSPTMRMFQKLTLEAEGYVIAEAANGVEALKRVTEFRPDAVLMDIVMPEMDGIQCCRQIKSNPTTQQIVVIMVSTQGEDDKIRRAYAAGCDDYVTKPIRKIELVNKLRKLLNRE